MAGSSAYTSAAPTISQGKGRYHTRSRLGKREDAAREGDQAEYEQPELHDRKPAHGHERSGYPFDQAERNPAQERAGRVAEAAKHGDHEAFELIGLAREHREGKQGSNQRSRHAGERDAEAERERENLGGGNARELGSLAVVGHRADRLADACAVEQEVE